MKMVVITSYIALFCIQLLQPYITGLHKMVTEKKEKHGFSDMYTAMVLSQEGL